MIRAGLPLLLLLAGCVADFPVVGQLAEDDGGRTDAAPDEGLSPDAGADRGPSADMRLVDMQPVDMLTVDMQPIDMQPADMQADQPCMPTAEVCNGVDDDCNDLIDDVPGLAEACSVGVGACAQPGTTICDPQGGAVICDAVAGAPLDETCNAIDDDCDGMADEGLSVGDACVVGIGACANDGVIVCDPDENATCDAMASPPGEETCNATDDDCDGTADEGFGLGDACGVGVGACAREGALICADDGSAACDAVPGVPAEAELCNAIDDDCDATTDEGFDLGAACTEGVGECLADGVRICAEDGTAICDAIPGVPVDEICNALDDDCDGAADEGLGLGDACTVGVGECRNSGVLVCRDDAAACSVDPRPAADERCDGLDNDCDGRIDEGDTCADFVVGNCRVWLGYRDNFNGNLVPFGTVGDCPGDASDNTGDARCNSTRGDGRFRSLSAKGAMDDNDTLGLRFVCESGDAGIRAWVQQSCHLALAYGDVAAPQDLERLDPAQCQDTFDANGLARGCARTDNSGRFHSIRHTGGVNGDDQWAVAFTCADAALPDRAAGVQASVVMQLGLQWRGETLGFCNRGRIDDADDWRSRDGEGCPLIGADRGGTETCASTSGDGAFHAFGSAQDVNRRLGSCWAFGVALKRLPPP